MADDDEPDKVWDEYDWERFLQQQDRKTEKYMELLERYIDDPNRDQIIAREMGWYHLLDKEGEEWEEQVDALFEEVVEEDRDDEPATVNFLDEVHGYESHPLYQASFDLTIWIDKLLEEIGAAQCPPGGVKLSNHTAVASAKLAAALSDDDVDEIGMTIAYLKRGLKSIITAMEASTQLRTETNMTPEQFAALSERLFQIRDGIITLMGHYRTVFRRRHEGH